MQSVLANLRDPNEAQGSLLGDAQDGVKVAHADGGAVQALSDLLAGSWLARGRGQGRERFIDSVAE